MIAVAKIGGHQAIVKVGDVLRVDKLDVEVGKVAKFETLLIADEDGKNCAVGAPIVEGKMVEATVVAHGRGDKIKVYKMKPRKRYRRTIGHRQDFTEIEIKSIGGAAAKPKAAAKKAEPKAEAKKAAKSAPKANVKADDLTKIEGIGPKITELLQADGINTYAQLGKATKKQLTEMLEQAGGSFKAHDPSTWAKQAKMAADGKWDELKAWQEELNGGKTE